MFSVLTGIAVLAIFLLEARAGGAVEAPIALVVAAVVVIGSGLTTLVLVPARRGLLIAPFGP